MILKIGPIAQLLEFFIIHFVTVLRLQKQIKIVLYIDHTCLYFQFIKMNLIVF